MFKELRRRSPWGSTKLRCSACTTLTPLLVRCRAGMARSRCRCSSASGVESLTALNLLSARFFVEKAFFDWYHTLLSSAAISKRLCEKWYNRAEEQGESERRWSNEKTQLLKSI